MKKGNIIKIIISIILVTIITILFVYNINIRNQKNEQIKGQKNIILNVYNKEKESIYSKKIVTFEKTLDKVLENEKELDVKMETSEYGKYILSIKGIEQSDGYYWNYYINDEYAQVGVSSCKINEKDVYSFYMEAYI